MIPDLGKYAFAVLASYGATLGLLGVIVLVTWRRGVRVRETLHRMESRIGARRDTTEAPRKRAGADG